MAKIRFESWKFPVNHRKMVTGYYVDGAGWYSTSSEHGRSKGVVICPCCGYKTDIYIWSFCGGGKRCDNCNVLLGTGGAFLYVSEVTNKVSITHDQIIKNF